MKNLRRLPGFLIAAGMMAFTACESEDPAVENDGEVITDVTLTFTELDASGTAVGSPFSFKASDPQGIEVGASPTIETVTLSSGKTYQLDIEVFNSIENEDITEEILEEGDEHQFYFLGSLFVGSPAPASYAYNDAGGELIGLRGIVTMQSSPGTNTAAMRVVLRHDLNKNFEGATNPHFANYEQAGGESDLDILFPVVIE